MRRTRGEIARVHVSLNLQPTVFTFKLLLLLLYSQYIVVCSELKDLIANLLQGSWRLSV